MVTKRVNVTIPGELHELLRKAADAHYDGNLSRYLTDAGLYYAGVLAGRHDPQPEIGIVELATKLRNHPLFGKKEQQSEPEKDDSASKQV